MFNRHVWRPYRWIWRRAELAILLRLPLPFFGSVFLAALAPLPGGAEGVTGIDAIAAVDSALAEYLFELRSPQAVSVFLVITMLGEWLVAILVMAVAFLVMALRQQRRQAIVLVLTVVCSQMTTTAGKLLFGRARPGGLLPAYVELTYAFPSGHASIAAALYGFLTYFAVKQAKSRRWKVTIMVAGGLVILAIGFSRMYLGVHYLSDVLGGYLVGTFWLLVSTIVLERKRAKTARPALTSIFKDRR